MTNTYHATAFITESPLAVTMRIRHYFPSVLTPSSTASSYDLVSVGNEVFSGTSGSAPDDIAAEDRRSKTLPRDFSERGRHRSAARQYSEAAVVAHAHVAAYTAPKKPARRSFSSPGDPFKPAVVPSGGHLLTFDPKSPDPISFLPPPPPPRVLPPRQLPCTSRVPPSSPSSSHHEDGLGGGKDHKVGRDTLSSFINH